MQEGIGKSVGETEMRKRRYEGGNVGNTKAREYSLLFQISYERQGGL